MGNALRTIVLLALVGCDAATLEPPPRCVALAGEPAPAAESVCGNLSRLGCFIDQCSSAYESYRSRVAPEEFARLTSCYARARNCDEVSQCERGCGANGGAVRLGPPGSVDAAVSASDATTDATTDASTDATTDATTDVTTDDASSDS
jgi:hypothetical protein